MSGGKFDPKGYKSIKCGGFPQLTTYSFKLGSSLICCRLMVAFLFVHEYLSFHFLGLLFVCLFVCFLFLLYCCNRLLKCFCIECVYAPYTRTLMLCNVSFPM